MYNCSMFTWYENTQNLRVVVSWALQLPIWKLPSITKFILKIQTWVIPSQQFVNLPPFPYVNLFITLSSKPNKFPHSSSNINCILPCHSFICIIEKVMCVSVCLSLCLAVCGSHNTAGNKDGGLKFWQWFEECLRDMLCQTYVSAVCGNSGSGPFYPAEWWVKV